MFSVTHATVSASLVFLSLDLSLLLLHCVQAFLIKSNECKGKESF